MRYTIITIILLSFSFMQNYAIEFDGLDDEIIISSSFFNGSTTNDFTIECWAKSSNTSWNKSLWGKHVPGQSFSEAHFSFGHDIAGIYWKDCQPQNNSYDQINTGFIASVNEWHHFAVSQQGNTLRVFVDGNIVGQINTNGTINWIQGEGYNKIGSYKEHNFNGIIDEFRVSSIARYTDSFTPQFSNFESDSYTEVLYHFDDIINGYIQDQSSNGKHASVIGAILVHDTPYDIPIQKGDLTQDYEINVQDVIILVDIILDILEAGYIPTDEELQIGDIYLDGQLNIVDIVALVNIILDQ